MSKMSTSELALRLMEEIDAKIEKPGDFRNFRFLIEVSEKVRQKFGVEIEEINTAWVYLDANKFIQVVGNGPEQKVCINPEGRPFMNDEAIRIEDAAAEEHRHSTEMGKTDQANKISSDSLIAAQKSANRAGLACLIAVISAVAAVGVWLFPRSPAPAISDAKPLLPPSSGAQMPATPQSSVAIQPTPIAPQSSAGPASTSPAPAPKLDATSAKPDAPKGST